MSVFRNGPYRHVLTNGIGNRETAGIERVGIGAIDHHAKQRGVFGHELYASLISEHRQVRDRPRLSVPEPLICGLPTPAAQYQQHRRPKIRSDSRVDTQFGRAGYVGVVRADHHDDVVVGFEGFVSGDNLGEGGV